MKFLIAFLLASSNVLCSEPLLNPSTTTLSNFFDEYVATIERLDGDGLLPRKNRPETWPITVAKIKQEFINSKDKIDMGQALKRLDQTYTNLHSSISLNSAYDLRKRDGSLSLPISIKVKTVLKNQKSFTFLLSKVKSEAFTNNKEITPQVGDEVIAINNQKMQLWEKELFLSCKYPLREQCYIEFFDQLRKEYLGWDRRTPLNLTLKRKLKVWTVNIPLPVADNSNQVAEKSFPCNVNETTYKPFKISYTGLNACAYEDVKQPGIVLLRISSFNYSNNPEEKIGNITEETKLFWEMYWKQKAPITKKLIIDVSDNSGGDSPIRWYELFFNHPFQEQYVRFKNITELENDDIKKALFYNDPAKFISYKNFKANGIIAKLTANDFLPPVPAFCANSNHDCREDLYSPLDNKFKGQVRIITNQWCHSSCVGFVWNMKDVLKDRVKFVGLPDNGDGTYGRVIIRASFDSKFENYNISIHPRTSGKRANAQGDTFFEQTISVTQSTDRNGRTISGIPQKMDVWIPITFDINWEQWQSKALIDALKR